MPHLLLTVLVLLSGVLQPSDVRVYVFTAVDPLGFSDPLQAQRLDSVMQLKAALDRKKAIAVVEQADGADITIEVLRAGKLDSGAELTKPGPIIGTRTTKETKPQVQAMLRAGTYQLEFHGTSARMKTAAGAVAKGVEKWVKQNLELLEERRRSAK